MIPNGTSLSEREEVPLFEKKVMRDMESRGDRMSRDTSVQIKSSTKT